MALSFAESIPVVFYSLFAISIVVILVLIKLDKVRHDESEDVPEEDICLIDVLYCVEDMKIPGRMILCQEGGVPGSISTNKQRNRHRYHRKSRPSERKNTASQRDSTYSPMLYEYDTPRTPSEYISCASVYSNDNSPFINESDNVTETADESQQDFKRDKSQEWRSEDNLVKFRSIHDMSLGNGEKQARPSAVPVTANTAYPPSNDVAENAWTPRSILDQNPYTLREREVRGTYGETQEKRVVNSSPSNLATSGYVPGYFHLPVPAALPTTAGFTREYVDSPGKMDTRNGSPPKQTFPVCYLEQDANAARDASGQIFDHYKGGAESATGQLAMTATRMPNVFISPLANQTYKCEDGSHYSPRYVSSESYVAHTCRERKEEQQTQVDHTPKNCGKHHAKRRKHREKTQIEAAAKELIMAYIGQAAPSQKSSRSTSSWMTTTETTNTAYTSTWSSPDLPVLDQSVEAEQSGFNRLYLA